MFTSNNDNLLLSFFKLFTKFSQSESSTDLHHIMITHHTINFRKNVFKNSTNQKEDTKILASDWLFQFLLFWFVTLINNLKKSVSNFRTRFKVARSPKITFFTLVLMKFKRGYYHFNAL
jgi:hypothetical protein